ncbi:MAG: DEAD/DEAH box helicase [Rickettsiales bacterium]|nr:DEAD/DEAH box helicase [Rickettsiales bacterium]
MTSFTNLNLNPKILSALEKKGYVTPTPIQLQAIPPLLEGKDLLGIAQTGTGKTAAFSLPILHNLAKSGTSVKSGCVRALILTPTRELASQIAENIDAYGKELGLRYALVYGGVSDRPQIAELQRGVDILIATPGRLLDLTNQGHIRFMQVEVLVLDEADRMLDMGFVNDIKKVIAKIPAKRQTLFFSATMPATITDLADSILTNPIKIAVTPQSTTVERIDQKIYFVERKDKLSLLRHILKKPDATSVIVFSRTKHGADDVEDFLNRNSISCAAIHGDKDQDQREKSLNRFREGKIQVLVATDVAARGIDVPAISHVINFDIPVDPESYVHRIGRTARAGRQGVAISFCDPHDDTLLRAVEKAINYKIPVDDSHPYSNKKSTPMQQNKKEERPRSNHSNKAPEKRVEHKHPAKKAPKKTGIFGFLAGLFKGKKPAAKVVEKKSEPQRKPAPKRNDSRKPQGERRAPERREPRDDRRAPERRDERNAQPREERRERPAPRTGAPIARTGGRKISSGKKD